MGTPKRLGRGVNILLMSGLGIAHLHQSHIGQLCHPTVIHLDGHHIMLAVGNGERTGEISGINEVAQYKGCATLFQHIGQILYGHLHVRPPAFGLEIKQFADDVEDMFLSLLGRNELLNPVRKEHDTNLIIVLNGRKSKRGSNLCLHLLLHLPHRTKIEAGRNIHHEHHRHFAFFLEHLDVGFAHAGRHVPVNVAHIIAILILAHLRESHTPPLEGRMVLASKEVAGESARFDFYPPDTLYQFIWFHIFYSV